MGGDLLHLELDSQIFLYDGSSTTQLTNDSGAHYLCSYVTVPTVGTSCLNEQGQVVWTRCDHFEETADIWLYDGTNTIELTEDSPFAVYPDLNENGWVVWQGCDGADCWGGEGDWEVFLYDGTSVSQLTDNSVDDLDPRLNNRGSIVWEQDGNIFLATLPSGYSATASAEASTSGLASVAASGTFNGLTLVLIPIGAVILFRILRRRG
jgi:hypothetical protein